MTLLGISHFRNSLEAFKRAWNTLQSKAGPTSDPYPDWLFPPPGAATPEWWEEFVAMSRECDNPALPDRPWNDNGHGFVSRAYHRDHLFLGCAQARKFYWDLKSVEGPGVLEWNTEHFRDWKMEGPYPLYLHTDLLDGHMYVCGPTGTQKTTIVLMSIAIQLIRGFALRDGTRSALEPMVIIDNKGDNALFHTIRAEAFKRGQTFKFFDLRPGRPTYRFNPFAGFRSGLRSVSQVCQMMLDAIGLNHGSEYGRGYYTERSRQPLHEALKVNPDVRSFAELSKTLDAVLRKERDKRARSDSAELLAKIKNLTEYDQLLTSQTDNATDRDGVIFMPDVLKNREIVYFWLPAALEPISAGMIAKLVLFNLRAAADAHREQYPEDRVKTTVFVDELQRVVGENLGLLLCEIRSFGIRAILCNQTLEDLKLPSRFDLAPTVLANTRVKIFTNSQRECTYYAFTERGCGATHPRPYPSRTNPLLRKLLPEEFGYRVWTQWPLSADVYRERDRTPLPGWEDIPGGNWRQSGAIGPVAPECAKPAHDHVGAASPARTFEPVIDQLRAEQLAFVAGLFSPSVGEVSS